MLFTKYGMAKSTSCCCKDCGISFSSFVKLSRHIKDKHKISSEVYYLKHYGRPKCLVCGCDTNFINLSVGYRTSCGNSHAGIINRAALKEDPLAFASFSQKVADNMKRTWAERDNTEIRKKIGKTRTDRLQKLSAEDRRVLCNHNPKGYPESLIHFWKTASDSLKNEIRKRRDLTITSKTDVTDKEHLHDQLWLDSHSDRLYKFFENYDN